MEQHVGVLRAPESRVADSNAAILRLPDVSRVSDVLRQKLFGVPCRLVDAQMD